MSNLKIVPITLSGAQDILNKAQHAYTVTPLDFAIAVENSGNIVGVIVMCPNGIKCKLGHLWTSGEPLVGSILYGAAWRACKALGYSQVSL